jgi:hypothetical protein
VLFESPNGFAELKAKLSSPVVSANQPFVSLAVLMASSVSEDLQSPSTTRAERDTHRPIDRVPSTYLLFFLLFLLVRSHAQPSGATLSPKKLAPAFSRALIDFTKAFSPVN